MNAFFNHLWLQFKMDIRERSTLLIFYLVPLTFYFVMGAVFSSINPSLRQTLSAAMIIFAVTMGAVLGIPAPIVKMRESGVLRSYRIYGIPESAVLLTQAVSAFFHLLIVSVIIFSTAPLLYGADYPQSFSGYFLTILLLLFANIAIGLFIGVAAGSQTAAVMLSQAIFLPTVLLGGIMFPASMLPELLRMLGHLLPATYIMQLFYGLAFRMPTDIGIALSLCAAAGFGVAAAGFAALRFRVIGKTL